MKGNTKYIKRGKYFCKTTLLKSVEELKTVIATEQIKSEERERRAEEERTKARAREQQAEDERAKAEERARTLAEQNVRNVTILTDIIAPQMAPRPITTNKIRILGTYVIV